MQTVSKGDNLHEMSADFFLQKIKYFVNLSSAEFALRVVRVTKVVCKNVGERKLEDDIIIRFLEFMQKIYISSPQFTEHRYPTL